LGGGVFPLPSTLKWGAVSLFSNQNPKDKPFATLRHGIFLLLSFPSNPGRAFFSSSARSMRRLLPARLPLTPPRLLFADKTLSSFSSFFFFVVRSVRWTPSKGGIHETINLDAGRPLFVFSPLADEGNPFFSFFFFPDKGGETYFFSPRDAGEGARSPPCRSWKRLPLPPPLFPGDGRSLQRSSYRIVTPPN